MKNPLVAGSRDSALALVQTKTVIATLTAKYAGLNIELKTYKTQGDLLLDTALSQIGDKGLFVKELEVALLKGDIDFAVHSMKDMPAEQPENLFLLPFGRRDIPLDAFISKIGEPFDKMPSESVIGTSSLRRRALLKKMRPDLHIQVVRGNVQTRLKKLNEGPYDAIVLASAGLYRLDLQHLITHTFTPEEMLPAPCQGTLAIELQDKNLVERFKPLIPQETQVCTAAERAFLKTLQGGCQIPMAAYAMAVGKNSFHMTGLVSDPDGVEIILAERDFTPDCAKETGEAIAQEILERGGKAILDNLLHHSASL